MWTYSNDIYEAQQGKDQNMIDEYHIDITGVKYLVDYMYVCVFKESFEYTFEVYGIEEDLEKIDKKFLPDEVFAHNLDNPLSFVYDNSSVIYDNTKKINIDIDGLIAPIYDDIMDGIHSLHTAVAITDWNDATLSANYSMVSGGLENNCPEDNMGEMYGKVDIGVFGERKLQPKKLLLILVLLAINMLNILGEGLFTMIIGHGHLGIKLYIKAIGLLKDSSKMKEYYFGTLFIFYIYVIDIDKGG